MSRSESITNQNPTFLVTGAGGQLGRRVLELLIQAKPGKLVATTRSPDKLAEFAKQTQAPIEQKVTKDGLVITLQEGVDADALFESGKADLTPRAQQLFDALVQESSTLFQRMTWDDVRELFAD